VDCVAYDLEDSVTSNKKAEARSNLKHFLGQPRASGITEQAVRINAVETGLALEDLKEVVRHLYSFCRTIHSNSRSYKHRTLILS
jgi:citrate lyase subunit beta-like protein